VPSVYVGHPNVHLYVLNCSCLGAKIPASTPDVAEWRVFHHVAATCDGTVQHCLLDRSN